MPKLWLDSIEAHRHAVQDAVVEGTASLVAENGLGAVTMTEVARRAGIGRATLYKHFDNVEAILVAWHEREVEKHLHHLVNLQREQGAPLDKLVHILRAYAEAMQHQHQSPMAAVLHRGDTVGRAHQHLRAFIATLIAEGVAAGEVRDDAPVDELANFVLHSVGGASALPSKAAALRLVTLTVDGLRPAVQEGSDAPDLPAPSRRHVRR